MSVKNKLTVLTTTEIIIKNNQSVDQRIIEAIYLGMRCITHHTMPDPGVLPEQVSMQTSMLKSRASWASSWAFPLGCLLQKQSGEQVQLRGCIPNASIAELLLVDSAGNRCRISFTELSLVSWEHKKINSASDWLAYTRNLLWNTRQLLWNKGAPV